MELFTSIGLNIISSIIYDIGKMFIMNKKKPLSEKQILDIIGSFQSDIDCIFDSLHQIERDYVCIRMQNETILRLLLIIFDRKNDIILSYSEQGYVIGGDYSLNNLSAIAKGCLERYAYSLPSTPPHNLGEAIWPIPHKLKGELLDEIENNLCIEDF